MKPFICGFVQGLYAGSIVGVAIGAAVLLISLCNGCARQPHVEHEPRGHISWPGTIDLSGVSYEHALFVAQEFGSLPMDGVRIMGASDGLRAELYLGSASAGWDTLHFDACDADGWPSPDGPTHLALWCIAPGESLLVQVDDRFPRLNRRWQPGIDWRYIPPIILGGGE